MVRSRGKPQGFNVVNNAIQLMIDEETLFCLLGSEEAKCFQEKLDATLIGRRIAILRTDILDKPFLIRLVS